MCFFLNDLGGLYFSLVEHLEVFFPSWAFAVNGLSDPTNEVSNSKKEGGRRLTDSNSITRCLASSIFSDVNWP